VWQTDDRRGSGDSGFGKPGPPSDLLGGVQDPCDTKENKVVKVIRQMPHCRRARTVQSYLPGGANVSPCNILASLGPPVFTTASRSVQPFLHSSRQSVPTLHNGPPLSLSKFPLRMGNMDPVQCVVPLAITKSFFRTRVHNPNGISIGSAVFAGLTTLTDRRTDRPYATPSVTHDRIYVRSTAMRPKKLASRTKRTKTKKCVRSLDCCDVMWSYTVNHKT